MLRRLQRFIQNLQASEKLELSYILGTANPDASLNDRAEWLKRLVDWLRSRGSEGPQPATRLKFMLQLLERHPEWKLQTARTLVSVMRDSNAIRLYSETGLPSHPTFSNEFWSRIGRILIPHFDDPTKLSELLSSVFYASEDAEVFRELPFEFWSEISAWLRSGTADSEVLFPRWELDVLAGAQILLNRALTIALRQDVSDRAPEFPILNHPLLKAQKILLWIESGWSSRQIEQKDFDHLAQCIYEAQDIVLAVRKHLEATGVSVDLIYQMERMRSDLHRLQRLLNLLRGRLFEPEMIPKVFSSLWADLLKGLEHDRDAGFILRKHLGLLSRKVVERTGYSGEHYVAQTGVEYRSMFLTALGGGAITAFTAFIKYSVDTQNWPLFLEFLYNSTNYSISFLVMHFLGFKLATKQPSMTAAHLASKLKEDGENESFVDEVARIASSQFAAVAGNIVAVIPMVLLIDWAFAQTSGRHFFTEAKGAYVLHSVHPLLSATIFYATITGFLLWLSSMIAGWCENASAFFRIPALIKSHPFFQWALGPARAQKLSEVYMYNVSGVVGSVALGILLNLIPLLGKLFGVSLQAFHVTLTTAGVTYAFQGHGFDWETFAWTVSGVFCIGLLNFGVSFYIALMIAVRARDIPNLKLRTLARNVRRRFFRRPLEFFLPAKKSAESSVVGKH